MTTYVLPVYDENGLQFDVSLVDAGSGYSVVPVYDESGTSTLIENEPAAGAPVGEFPVYDESGTQWLIPFASSDVVGFYEDTTNRIRSHLSSSIEEALGLSVQWDNGPEASHSIGTSVTVWAQAGIEFEGGEELIGVGAGVNRYRMRGEAVVLLRIEVQHGDDAPLSYVEDLKALLRDQDNGPVRFEDPYHVVRGRDGAWWSIEVRAPFRSDAEIDRPVPLSDGAVESGAIHDTIRGLFKAYVADALGVEVFWDNAARSSSVGSTWCRAAIVTGSARTAEAGTRLRARRQVGVLKAMIAVPVGTLDRDAWRVVDALANALRARSSSGVRFSLPSARVLGRQGAFWVVAVDLPFTADEVV